VDVAISPLARHELVLLQCVATNNYSTGEKMKAFPHTTNYGMDLRDWFAGLAMQSMNSRPDYEDVSSISIALDAYTLADAMMKVRNETNK